jgi:hypothetical protein
VQYDPENVVLDIERVVGRSKNKRLVEGLRVVIVRLKTNQKKHFFYPKRVFPSSHIETIQELLSFVPQKYDIFLRMRDLYTNPYESK